MEEKRPVVSRVLQYFHFVEKRGRGALVLEGALLLQNTSLVSAGKPPLVSVR
jgi:hypothetical protein